MKLSKIMPITLLSMIFSSSYAADPHWIYEEQAEWGAIEQPDTTIIPERYPFAECGLGHKQSPINISSAVLSPLNPLHTDYVAMPLSVNNNGHSLKVNTPSTANPNKLRIGRESYELLQFHFHTPSEHQLNGQAFPAELHLVHATASGKLAVVGVFIRQSKTANAELQKILDHAPAVANTTNNPEGLMIDINQLLPLARNFYNYAGSLTTPPCTEGVDWYVLRHSIPASEAQIEQLKQFYDNARAPQELYGRAVQMNH